MAFDDAVAITLAVGDAISFSIHGDFAIDAAVSLGALAIDNTIACSIYDAVTVTMAINDAVSLAVYGDFAIDAGAIDHTVSLAIDDAASLAIRGDFTVDAVVFAIGDTFIVESVRFGAIFRGFCMMIFCIARAWVLTEFIENSVSILYDLRLFVLD